MYTVGDIIWAPKAVRIHIWPVKLPVINNIILQLLMQIFRMIPTMFLASSSTELVNTQSTSLLRASISYFKCISSDM